MLLVTKYSFVSFYLIAGDLCIAWTSWQHQEGDALQHELAAKPPEIEGIHFILLIIIATHSTISTVHLSECFLCCVSSDLIRFVDYY